MAEDQPEFQKRSKNPDIKPALGAKLVTVFEREGIDPFFRQAVNFAISDPLNFSAFYNQFSQEKFPDVHFVELPDNRLCVLSSFAYRIKLYGDSNKPDAQELWVQMLKEAKEFYHYMDRRKQEVQQKGEKILSELHIHEQGQPLSFEKIDDQVNYFRRIINSDRIFDRYYLYTKGEFPVISSVADRQADLEDEKDYDKFNDRIDQIRENPKELSQAIEIATNKVKEIIERSNDPERIKSINQENLNAAPEYILKEGDFLHGAHVESIDQIAQHGILCRELAFPGVRTSSYNHILVVFGRQLEKKVVKRRGTLLDMPNPLITMLCENTFYKRYRGNVARDYGAQANGESSLTNEEELEYRRGKFFDIKAAGDDAITYIFKEQKDAYEMDSGTETPFSDEYGLPIGVPSTEIKGMIVDANRESALKKVLPRLAKFPFYVPLYDSETGVLINDGMKKLFTLLTNVASAKGDSL